MARTYLVMESILLIGEDLAHAIREYDAGAKVLVTMSEEEALGLIAQGAVVDRAILHSDPAETGASPLGRALMAADATLIFIGDKAERSPDTANVLHRPFDSISVASLLSALDEAMV